MGKITLVYDGSFEGFLTTIFEIYAQKIDPFAIHVSQLKKDLFNSQRVIKTDMEKAERVMKGIVARFSGQDLHFIHRCFLSEAHKVEMQLFYLIRKLFRGNRDLLMDFSDQTILELHQLHKKVGRETHRMHAFVRFQEMKDGLFAALIEPDFNVLPLIGSHFRDRYPAMRWFIFDLRRGYGVYHENRELSFKTAKNSPIKISRSFSEDMLAETELEFQQWWRVYFKSVNIPERRNDKLHRQHVPKRYWSYLIEKSNNRHHENW
jgi:probable DNA metabolism protein